MGENSIKGTKRKTMIEAAMEITGFTKEKIYNRCPKDFGFDVKGLCADDQYDASCKNCWEREVPETEEEKQIREQNEKELELLEAVQKIRNFCLAQEDCEKCICAGAEYCLLDNRPDYWEIPEVDV